jgi:peptide/nickel transport system permease protein
VLTLRIGLIAGAIGVGVGTTLAFISAYYRGPLDTIIRGVVDVLLTVPGLLILVVIASTNPRGMSVETMALIVATLAWLIPTRNIRAQVLSMRERPFLLVARLSGMNSMEIIFREMMPNLLPYLAAVRDVTRCRDPCLRQEGIERRPLGHPTYLAAKAKGEHSMSGTRRTNRRR